MPPRRRKSENAASEIDRAPGAAHPRQVFELVGQDDALSRAAKLVRAGRLPQGWLIGGPPGVGKATLAYRIARYVLRYGASADGPEDLDVAETDPVALQVKAGAHPGLLVLKRSVNPDTGKLMTVLSVDEIRRLVSFFGMTSGAGGWRVALIDTADDMNDAAANALLKLLEEPPQRALLLVLAHAPARLLPTIRSRCQKLDLRPLDDMTLTAEIDRRLPALSREDRLRLVRVSGGSIGAALRLASEEGLLLTAEAEKLIDGPAIPDPAAVLALADRVLRIDDGLEQLGEFLTDMLRGRIRARARAGGPGLRRWILLWEELDRRFGRAAALHLEPRQTILSSARALARETGRGPL